MASQQSYYGLYTSERPAPLSFLVHAKPPSLMLQARLASFLTIKQPQQAAHLGSLPFLVFLPDALHPDGHIFFSHCIQVLLKHYLVRENFPNHLYERAQAFPSSCTLFPLAFVTLDTIYMIYLLIVFLPQQNKSPI